MSLATRITALAQAIATDIKALTTGKLGKDAVGPAPNQIPASTHLGQLAFADSVGLLDVYQHAPDSRPNQLWYSYVSNTDIRLKFHGFDGVAREISLVGPVGPKGDKGDKGDRGDTGAQGPQGLKGDAGETGVQGLQGLKGDQGAAGPQGLQGPKGDAGATGPQGLKGDTGAVGPQGIQGLKGDTGPQGIQGPKGDKGDVGTFDTGQVGTAPNQVPSVQHLGACVFEDYPGLMLVHLHTPDMPLNSVWRERVSDTETTLKYRGGDGVIRSRQELWS